MNDSSEKNRIYVGLDFPDVFGFWEMNEIILASSAFMIFILMQEVLFGIFFCFLVLYFFHKTKDHAVRGRQDHFFWKIGILHSKGFGCFPPAQVTRFDG